MKKIIANLLYKFAKWMNPRLSVQEYNAKKYEILVKDLARLNDLRYWVAEPYHSSPYRDALKEKLELEYTEDFDSIQEADFDDIDWLDEFTWESKSQFSNELVEIRSEQPEHQLKEVYKPLEPFESQEFQELNDVLEKLRYHLNYATENAQTMEKLHQDFTRGVIKFLDELEGAVRGDLTVYVEPNCEYFVDLGAIADVCNLIIENFRKDLQTLPVTHPLRQKYKVE